jgi:hypothetical protein
MPWHGMAPFPLVVCMYLAHSPNCQITLRSCFLQLCLEKRAMRCRN